MSEAGDRQVLLVVRQRGNARVLEQAFGEAGMVAKAVSSEAELTQALSDDHPARCALVDIGGFGNTVWPMCELLRQHDVPFVVLAEPLRNAVGSRSLQYGARSVLQKPVAKTALLDLVHSLFGGNAPRSRGT